MDDMVEKSLESEILKSNNSSIFNLNKSNLVIILSSFIFIFSLWMLIL